MKGGKEGDGFFGRQRVDTRSMCLGQTGSETVLLHLTSCNLMEQFLSSNNGMVIGRERSIRLVLMDKAGWDGRESRSRGDVSGDNRAEVYHSWG